MAKLDAHVSARAAAKGADIDRVSEAAPLALRHPAHPMGPARLAYLAETADPPRLREAVQWANKTLYLAPTYADVYVAVGRLLMGAGHRDQGLDSMRQGWALVDPFRRDALIRRIVARCETWQEVRRAVPRQDLVQDILDGEQAAHAALALDRMQGKAGARALLETLNPEQVAPDDLNMVAWAALAVRADAIAEGAVKRRRRLVPADPRAARTQLQLLNTLGRTEEAHALLRELVDAGGLDPVPLLRVQAPITIQERRFELAREVIDTLERTAAPTISTQVEVARLRASLSARAGRTQEALGVLQTGIRLAPGDPSLRLQRAKLLLRLGRRAEASLDLDHVLKLRPDHPEAQALRDALEAARPTTPPRPELIPTPSSGTPAPTRP